MPRTTNCRDITSQLGKVVLVVLMSIRPGSWPRMSRAPKTFIWGERGGKGVIEIFVAFGHTLRGLGGSTTGSSKEPDGCILFSLRFNMYFPPLSYRIPAKIG